MCKKNLRHHQKVNLVNKGKLPSFQDQLLYIRCETGKSLPLFMASLRFEYEKDEKLFDIILRLFEGKTETSRPIVLRNVVDDFYRILFKAVDSMP